MSQPSTATTPRDGSMITIPQLSRFLVYRKALTLLGGIYEIALHGSLRDQMNRAAESVVLNIAEGAAQRSLAMRNKHLEIARGSLWEVGSCLDVLAIRGVNPCLAAPVREIDAMLRALLGRR